MNTMLPDSNSGKWKYWQIDCTGLFVCAVLTAAIYLVGVRALMSHVELMSTQKSELRASRARATDVAASIQSLRTQLTAVRGEIEKLPLELESAREINQRIARLTDLAGETGLEITDIQPGAPTSKPRFAIIPITLSGVGDWRACARFLHDVRQVFPDSGVATFELTGNPSDPAATAQFRLGIIWHVAPLRVPGDKEAVAGLVNGEH